MKCKVAVACVVSTCLCLAGTAIAQERAFAQPGHAFQSSGGLVGGLDVLFLRAYGNTYDEMMHRNLSNGDIAPSNDYEISPRMWLGYVGQSGFGIRSRWFQYQHTLKAATGTFADWPDADDTTEARNYLDVYAVDIDFMQRVDLGCWDLNAGAGIRVGGVKRLTTLETTRGSDTLDAAYRSRFEGVGPTIFAELKRPIIGTGISLIANARGALLFGDGRWEAVEEAGGSDSVVGVGEVQIGLEYARQLGYGTIGFAQCVWEGQMWSNATQFEGGRDDLGLTGIALNFGITR